MLQKNKLKAKICELNYNLNFISAQLGIKPATLYRKMNGKSEFKRCEIETLVGLLHIDNPTDIFFS